MDNCDILAESRALIAVVRKAFEVVSHRDLLLAQLHMRICNCDDWLIDTAGVYTVLFDIAHVDAHVAL